MSGVSKNPFELLDEDNEGGMNAPLATESAPVKKEGGAPKAAAAAGGKSAGGAARGGGGGGGPRAGGGKREYDRHSGTGRGRAADGAEDKRGGTGKYNWGSKADGTTPEDEAKDAADMTEEEKEAAAAAEEARRKEEAKMSYDEYMKNKAADAEAEKLSAREVEAIDMKGLKVAAKDEEDAFAVGEGSKKNKGKKSSGRTVASADANLLGFKSAPLPSETERRDRDQGDRRRSGGGPGGRGGGRGGGGRGGGGPRGPRASGPGANINIADDAAFPTLG